MWVYINPQYDQARLECQKCGYTWNADGLWCSGEEGPEFEDRDEANRACEECGSEDTDIVAGWTPEQGWVI